MEQRDYKKIEERLEFLNSKVNSWPKWKKKYASFNLEPEKSVINKCETRDLTSRK